jgi:hypothetical protein
MALALLTAIGLSVICNTTTERELASIGSPSEVPVP